MNQLEDPRGPPPSAKALRREKILDITFYIIGIAVFALLVVQAIA